MFTDSHRTLDDIEMHIITNVEQDDVEIEYGILFTYEGDFNVLSNGSLITGNPIYICNGIVEGGGLAALLVLDSNKGLGESSKKLPMLTTPTEYGTLLSAETTSDLFLNISTVESGFTYPRKNHNKTLRYFLEGGGTIRPEPEDEKWSIINEGDEQVIRGHRTFFEAYIEDQS